MRIFDYHSIETIYLKHFYNTPFTGDPMLEEIRAKKVAKAIKQMGDKYLLAKPVQRITEGATK